MKIAKVVEKTDKELAQLIEDSRRELTEAAIDMRTKQIPNVKRIYGIRRTLAQALTIQRERKIAQMEKQNG